MTELVTRKIRVKVAYGPGGSNILRADGDYSKKDYTDLRYRVVDLGKTDMDVGIALGKKPSEICKMNNAESGGNCMFAHKDGKGIYHPIGKVVKNQKLIQDTVSADKWADFILPTTGIPYVGQVNSPEGIKLGFTGTPQIVKAGKIFINSWIEGTPNDVVKNIRAKAGVGVTKDGKVIHAVLDYSSDDHPMRIDEFALVMIYLGSWDALGMDSGGSCVYWDKYKGVQNYPAKTSGERATSSALMFKPKPLPILQRPVKIVKDILGISPRIYKVYLSPSTQQWNIGVGGYNEEYWMHIIADKVAEILREYGIDVKVARKEQTLKQIIAESNNWKPDVHVANHSDAGPATARGATGFAWGTGTNSYLLAKCIYDEVSKVTPGPDRGVRDGRHLAEIRETNATAALTELSFHTNEKDAELIRTRWIEFAEAQSRGILKYLGFSF